MHLATANFNIVSTELTVCLRASGGDIFWQGYHIWQDTAGLPTENRSVWLTEKREFATRKDKDDRDKNTLNFNYSSLLSFGSLS